MNILPYHSQDLSEPQLEIFDVMAISAGYVMCQEFLCLPVGVGHANSLDDIFIVNVHR